MLATNPRLMFPNSKVYQNRQSTLLPFHYSKLNSSLKDILDLFQDFGDNGHRAIKENFLPSALIDTS